MSFWRQLTHGLHVLTHRSQSDQETADEAQDYLDQAVAELIAKGISPQDARRQARLDCGSASSISEEVRSHTWENLADHLLADIRYALRRLWHNPGFAAVSVLTLALGIGASTAIFSAVNPILFKPLPYPHADRIAMLWEMRANGRAQQPAFATYLGLSESARSFDGVAALKPWQPAIAGTGQPERLEGQSVSWSYFRVLGVSPLFGRDFNAADDRPGTPNVVIISDGLWRRRFGADMAILDRQIKLDDKPYLVIGIAPPKFENVLAPDAQIWSPLQYDISQGRAWGHHLRMISRIKGGVSLQAAAQELGAIMRNLGKTYAAGYETSGGPPAAIIVKPLQQDLTEAVRPSLLAIVGAVLLLLLIACVNVTNLLLSLGSQRQGELAMRTALGASRARLFRQLLTESVILALLGGSVGILVALLGVDALVAISPAGLPRAGAIALDGWVLAFAMAVTLIVGVIVGVLPAFYASRGNLRSGAQRASRRSSGVQRWTRRGLVSIEVALALVLLVSAGLILRSVQRIFAIAPGFEPSRVLTMQIQASGHRFEDDQFTHRYFAQVLEAVRQVPGVTAAAFTSQLPLSGDFDVYGMKLEPDSQTPTAEFGVLRYAVSPGYFEAMRIPLLHGRSFLENDRATSPWVAIVSESFARREFAGRDPIGHRMRLASIQTWYTIIGVVQDVKQTSLAIKQLDAVYVPSEQWGWADHTRSLVVGQRKDSQATAAAIRAAIWSVDKDQPIVRVATMDSLINASEAERHFVLTLFAVFAFAALVLAAVGICGILSGSVTERTLEIGVRSALGASRSSILTMVLRQGMVLTGIGIALGVIGAGFASRGLITLLFGTSPLDPVTYFGVAGLLAAVSLLACGIPAWRAAHVDPAIALRSE